MKGKWSTKDELINLLKQLTTVESVVGTSKEVEMGEKIEQLLGEIEYFKEYQDKVYRIPVKNDHWNRFNVAAIYEGDPNDQKAYVLLSHFDVVGIDDFGQYKHIAFDSDRYTKQMQQLEDVSPEVAADIESREWLFGRGVMDMKAGLAIQMAVLADAIEQKKKVNLILLSTPDEERNSEGMLAAIEWLACLKESKQYQHIIGLCSEPSFTSFPGDTAKYIYTGSVGKMLPLVCAVGKETHVGEPLAGVNASWMISEVVSEMELSERFFEQSKDELVPPPTVLRLSDLKYEYNVQTPTFAYATFNVLTYTKTAQEVLTEVKKVAEECGEKMDQRLEKRYQRYYVKQKNPPISVYTYGQLKEKGIALYGQTFLDQLESISKRVYQNGGDTRDVTIALAKEVGDYFIELAPFYLVTLAPPYYPAVRLNAQEPFEARLLEEVGELQKWTEERFGEVITQKDYFPGLSDVSYGKIEDGLSVKQTLEKEMPTLSNGYDLPLDAMQKLQMPTVNIGPFGKDAHKRTERLHVPFFTDIAPQMLIRFIDQMTKK
ncbi:M20/M25/M40 family metallo-hydrolase [Alkalihalophilus lindianensis]|uniref:M20/M25/M40 family metallo-hydrolase n=1 Tax=Alkalihalophilus lindianensis TaxID=1630542 RepID=A0ABU3XD98_9BACI|nr:M20/M25/M40 family metallo-hydrolase [Alkalihalophilus lindianensis]MDV2685861.1 M20/M25/M40 family metallo-hydrolase [Alkalihalophilus lindianensis]